MVDLSEYDCVVVSACLLGENCKYNGGNNYSAKLEELLRGKKIVSVCPEVLGGLSTPREPCEVKNEEVINSAGEKLTDAFVKGAEIAIKKAKENGAKVAVLQSRSPSCGVKQIYDGSFSKTLVSGQGIFARLLAENDIKIIDAEDITK